MNERFKVLRKKLGLSQDEFASRLGLTRGAVTNIELGKTEPKPLFISLVCSVYDVSEHWLRTGEGDIFIPKDLDDEIAEFMGTVLREDIRTSVRKRVIDAVRRIPPDMWSAIADILEQQNDEYGPLLPPNDEEG